MRGERQEQRLAVDRLDRQRRGGSGEAEDDERILHEQPRLLLDDLEARASDGQLARLDADIQPTQSRAERAVQRGGWRSVLRRVRAGLRMRDQRTRRERARWVGGRVSEDARARARSGCAARRPPRARDGRSGGRGERGAAAYRLQADHGGQRVGHLATRLDRAQRVGRVSHEPRRVELPSAWRVFAKPLSLSLQLSNLSRSPAAAYTGRGGGGERGGRHGWAGGRPGTR